MRSRRGLLQAAAAACLVLASAVVVGPGQALVAEHSTLGSLPIEHEVAAWLRVVEEVDDTVPAQLLLGGGGGHAALDAALAAGGMTRSDFQISARLVLKAVGECADDAAREALAISFSNFPLPEGIEIPDAEASDEMPRSPVLDAAWALVRRLTARLHAGGHEVEDA